MQGTRLSADAHPARPLRCSGKCNASGSLTPAAVVFLPSPPPAAPSAGFLSRNRNLDPLRSPERWVKRLILDTEFASFTDAKRVRAKRVGGGGQVR